MNSSDIIRLCLCVVLPIAVVLITSISQMFGEKQKANLLSKAIERGDIDANQLKQLLSKPRRSDAQIAARRLLVGCICTLIGLLLIICGLVSFFSGTPFGADPVMVPLVFGSIVFAIGVSFLIVYFVTRRSDSDNKK